MLVTCFFLIVKGYFKWYQQSHLLLNSEVFVWIIIWRVLWKWVKPHQLSFICQWLLSHLSPAVQSFPGLWCWGWRTSRLGMSWGERVYVCVFFSLFQSQIYLTFGITVTLPMPFPSFNASNRELSAIPFCISSEFSFKLYK